MNLVHVAFFIVTLTALEVTAELALDADAKSNTYGWSVVLGVTLYVILAVVFAYTMRAEPDNLGTINTAWQASNIFIVFLVAWWFLGEPFNVLHIVGAIMGLLGACLMFAAEVVDLPTLLNKH